MNPTATLAALASVFPQLPDQAVEENLVIFDALLDVSDAAYRPVAAQILRDAASAAGTEARRERLLRAVDAISSGVPVALTPDGLSAREAAAASTITADKWVEPPPAHPAEDTDDDDEDEDGSSYMEHAPPKLPHLSVRHFFRGLVLRIGRDFSDDQGNELVEGTVFKLLRFDPDGEGNYILIPLRSPSEASGSTQASTRRSPVPNPSSLQALCYWIRQELTKAIAQKERIDALREKVFECESWLGDQQGAPPQSAGSAVAETIFGRDHCAPLWTGLLFAALAVLFRQRGGA